MPWSEADRANYEVIRERYSSDLSDGVRIDFSLASTLVEDHVAAGAQPTKPETKNPGLTLKKGPHDPHQPAPALDAEPFGRGT
jgi:hypothetical protein